MKHLLRNTAIIGSLILASCGGGGNTETGGGAAANTGSTAGFYAGTAEATYHFNTLGVAETATIRSDFTFTEDTVTVTDGDVTGSANYQGDTYSVQLNARDTVDGIFCDINVTYNGRINGNTTSGSISGGGNCTVTGTRVPFGITGNYSATKSGNARSGSQSLMAIVANRLTN